MFNKNLKKLYTPAFVFGAICLVIFTSGCASSASVKGTILQSSGDPLANKEIILIPVLDGNRIKVFRSPARITEAPLNKLRMGIGDKIMFEPGRNRKARWKTKTNDAGNFVIRNVAPGKYVLFEIVAGIVIRVGTKEGHIIIDVQEEQIKDIGTITLLASNEKITP